MDLISMVKNAHRVGVPIIGIESVDQWATIDNLVENTGLPVVVWDIVKGLSVYGNNEKSFSILQGVLDGQDPMMFTNPTETLNRLDSFANENGEINAFFCMMNSQRLFDMKEASTSIVQGIMNLRGVFESKLAHLVLLAPVLSLPIEIKNDVMVFSEDLPKEEEIKKLVSSVYADFYNGMGKLVEKSAKELSDEDMSKAVDNLIGLPCFAIKQVTATCLSVNREEKTILFDKKGLWERKCKIIEQTPGLSVWRGGETFSDIGGCDNIKSFSTRILKGKEKPRAIVFMDEIEKMFSGATGDLSGVSQDQLGFILSYMQDKNVKGMIFIGPQGAAKSAVAKAMGNESGIPTVSFDLGAMKAGIVGQTGQQTRGALKVIDSISQGKALFVATCNSISSLPPELRRRFTLGTFFFDLPSKDERKLIWKIYKDKYNLTKEQCDTVSDEGWTGAEIRQACMNAYLLDSKLSEACGFVVPVAVAAKEQIEKLRNEASGRFINAGKPGLYLKELQNVSNKRKFSTQDLN